MAGSRPAFRGLARAILALAAALGGCAAPGADVHLAPLYTRIRTADGGVEVEALGGLVQRRRDAASGRFESATLGPLWSLDVAADRTWSSHFLVPLGYTSRRGGQGTSFLLPVYWWRETEREDGSSEWGLIALPGVLVRSNERQGTEVAWFPVAGSLSNFLTYDHIGFFLWPLYVQSRRGERVSRHFLFPILGWTQGGGEASLRLFPLFGRTRLEGRYRRSFYLWPILHFQRNYLGGGGEEPERVWWVFPLAGRKERGTYRATTVLWPFFGYARDPRSGFWALDAPWPFVRLQRGPGDVTRTRFWPFYGHMRGDGLESTTFLWPIGHVRHERGAAADRDSVYVVPLWQSWDRRDLETGEESAWRKLFPLFQYERRGEWERGSFPTLDPFGKNALVDRHFSWLWKLYEWEEKGEMRRERSLLGLWRREKDAGEDRASLALLWSRRRYAEGDRRVRETSLLLGLLRWRVTEGGGFDMLRPAFPGPGWPGDRRQPAADADGGGAR
ncbi:MAG: hypothetical protein AB1726_07460 [Planctomycetota bacterium]